MRMIAHSYDTYAQAERVVHALEADGTGTGATIGTVPGGGAGLLAGLGSLAIPGIGPIVAAGWLTATLTGAGVDETEAQGYAEHGEARAAVAAAAPAAATPHGRARGG